MSKIRFIMNNKFVKFLFVGLLNTAFGYAIYAALILMGVGAQLALIIQFCIGVIWNYFTHARLVFGHRGYKKIPLYCFCYFGIYAFNAISLNILIKSGFTDLGAQAILTPFIAIISYLLISRVLKPNRVSQK